MLSPGAGFGDGTHETTQLCLQAISAFAPRDGRPWRVLDFGSGSGILSIAAARLSASVDAVEIDDSARKHSLENARLNGVAERIRFAPALPCPAERYDLVVANILRPVLLDFADALVARRANRGTLVLSGLVATDVPEVVSRFLLLVNGRRPDLHSRGEWRALVWRPALDAR